MQVGFETFANHLFRTSDSESRDFSKRDYVITALKFQWFSMFVNPWTSVYVFFNLILNQFHKFVDILITHLYNRKEEL